GGVLRLSRGALLPVGVGDLRIGLHDDPRLGAVDPRQERSGRIPLAVGEEMGRVFAEVPDVPPLVLCIVVERLLEHGFVMGSDVTHDRRGDAETDLRLVRDVYGVRRSLPVFLSVAIEILYVRTSS